MTEERKDYVLLSHDVLSIQKCIDLVGDTSAGAISTFIGTTRDHFQGKRVLKLSYEAYESMAECQLYALLKSVRERWNVHHAAVFHRLGEVPIGEASVMIAISSCHRKESLEAVSYAIDALKANVPIWKKEIYDDGDSTWKENSECSWATSATAAHSSSATPAIAKEHQSTSQQTTSKCEDGMASVS
ncbi:molybdopterin synthase catalytic subunit-like [Sycon ciliatum]|uniref:molybdopterin synthase catalytic subunit-like n=1 Tax=Sycon ciliatum TaxID=27933 RepID=UPI0031F632CA